MRLLTDHDSTYIIVGALDECLNASRLPSREQLLVDLVYLIFPNLQICVTGRPEIDTQTFLEDKGRKPRDIIDLNPLMHIQLKPAQLFNSIQTNM